jgi:hypothetical protein
MCCDLLIIELVWLFRFEVEIVVDIVKAESLVGVDKVDDVVFKVVVEVAVEVVDVITSSPVSVN